MFRAIDLFRFKFVLAIFCLSNLGAISIGYGQTRITTVVPNGLSAEVGGSISLRGTGFTGVNRVEVGGVVATRLTVASDASIRCTVPPVTSCQNAGLQDIVLFKPLQGAVATLRRGIDLVWTVQVDSISPDRVSTEGGDVIDVHGEGFTSSSEVLIAGNAVDSDNVTYVNCELLRVVTPSHTPTVRPLPVAVRNTLENQDTLANALHYVTPPPLAFNDFTPKEGEAGDSIEVTGSGFLSLTEIRLEDPAGDITVVDEFDLDGNTYLLFDIPDVIPADYQVTLYWSIAGAPDVELGHDVPLTILPPPTEYRFDDFNPKEVEVGDTIQVSGSGFQHLDFLRLTSETGAQTEIDTWRLGAEATLIFTIPENTLAGSYAVALSFNPVGVPDIVISHRLRLQVLEPPTPLTITSFSPGELLYQGGETFSIIGTGFEEGDVLEVLIGDQVLTLGDGLSSIEPTVIRGTSPFFEDAPLTVNPVVTFGDDAAESPQEVSVIGPLRINRVTQTPEPFPAGAGGGGEIELRGVAFRSSTRVEIGGEPLRDPVLTPEGLIRGTAPDLAADEYEVMVFDQAVDGTDLQAEASERVLYENLVLPQITAIEPYYLAINGRTSIAIEGTNLTRSTRIFFQGTEPGSSRVPVLAEFQNSRLMTATAPIYQAGLVNAIAREPDGEESVLQEAAEYVSPFTPAPQQIYGTLVNNQVEFSWVNPIEYSAIHVYREGQFVTTLPGNTTQFTDPVQVSESSAGYCMVGEMQNGLVSMIDFNILRLICDPPLDHGTADRGLKDFSLLGTHQPYEPPEEGQGGGAAVGFGNTTIGASNEANHFPVTAQLTREEKPQFAATGPFLFQILGPNELVTGFTLLKEATKIRIEIHGAKLISAADLSLRVLVQSVTEGVDRTVELEIPDVITNPVNDWMELTYNTLNPPPAPGEPFPDPGDPPLPAHDPLPPADYLVTIYAVGGELEPHYSISSDSSSDQIFVPFVRCPPYPLVKITDTTGRNSNPLITGIQQEGEVTEFFPLPDPNNPGILIPTVFAQMVAEVFDPDGDPISEYEWEIKTRLHGSDESGDIKTTAGNKLYYHFPTYGYYLVKLTVRDQRCGESTRSFVVKIRPPCITPLPGSGPNFTYPVPQPDRLHLVTNLPGNMDRFDDILPISFDAFVVDSSGCEGDAETHSVQFGLFTESQANSASPTPIQLLNGFPAMVMGCLLSVDPGSGDEILECDLSDPSGPLNDPFGGRFWRGTFSDSRLLPPVQNASQGVYVLMARGSTIPGRTLNHTTGWGPWKRVTVPKSGTGGSQATFKSAEVNVYNKPAFLDAPHAYSTGSFTSKGRIYHFTCAQGGPGQSSTSFPPTEEKNLSVLGNSIPFPSLNNQVGRTNQTTFMTFSQGFWALESHKGGVDTTTLNGKIEGDRELLASGPGGGGSAFGDEGLEALNYEYCERSLLFSEAFNTMLFNSILYSGFVGPVQVTISASVSLGVHVWLETQLEYAMRPFPGPGEEYFEADFWLLPGALVSLAAAIRADIFFGIASVEAGLNLNLEFGMPFRFRVDSAGPSIGSAIYLDMDIDFFYEICVALLCGGSTVDILDENLLNLQFGLNRNSVPAGCSNKDLREIIRKKVNEQRSQKQIGGGPPDLKEQVSQLDLASSPDGEVQIAVGVFTGVFIFNAPDFPDFVVWERVPGWILRQAGQPWIWQPRTIAAPTGEQKEYELIDPKVIFLDNDTVLFSGTRYFDGQEVLPEDDEITAFNKRLSRSEIVSRIGHITQPTEQKNYLHVVWEHEDRVTEDQGPDGYRGDGRSDLAQVPGTDTSWIAWVRYEVEDVVVALDPPVEQAPPLDPKTSLVQLKKTNIYAQRLLNSTPIGPRYLVSGDDDFIDIEVSLAVTPSGSPAISWLRDSFNDDLITSNIGRNLMFSKFEGNSWSAPEEIIADASELPGILEPSLALADLENGMVVFTALPANADPNDTGMGNTRMVYTTKLLNGVWQDPVLIYKDCNTPLFARWPNISFNPPVDGPDPQSQYIPDYTIYVNELGAIGTPEGAGNVSLVNFISETDTFSDVIQLTNDNRTHQGIAGTITSQGEVVVVHSSPDIATPDLQDVLQEGQGVGGGLPEGGPNTLFETGMMSFEARAVADPAISYCRLSDPYAGPGVEITAEVGIKNNGFARTPMDGEDMSSLFLRFIYVFEDGQEQVAQLQVPSLDPGDETFLTAQLVIPRRPGRIHVRVDEVEGELNVANNLRDCPLGAQPPKNVNCQLVPKGETWAVRLTWENAGLYNRVCVYREGYLLTELPGTSTSYLDMGEFTYDLRDFEGDFKYSVRGKLRHTISVESECEVFVPPPRTEGAQFRRGDVDGNGQLEITDPINNLAYQFLGTFQPTCLDACDFDDNGRVEITDPIGNLAYQFLGENPPGDPGPSSCGIDPTADELDPCEQACRP